MTENLIELKRSPESRHKVRFIQGHLSGGIGRVSYSNSVVWAGIANKNNANAAQMEKEASAEVHGLKQQIDDSSKMFQFFSVSF